MKNSTAFDRVWTILFVLTFIACVWSIVAPSQSSAVVFWSSASLMFLHLAGARWVISRLMEKLVVGKIYKWYLIRPYVYGSFGAIAVYNVFSAYLGKSVLIAIASGVAAFCLTVLICVFYWWRRDWLPIFTDLLKSQGIYPNSH